ncbi:MAG TPA: peptidoglycan editing factor PgeF [Terriglobales bacterium]|nr:peptidoglycan editing factor PgeF [Terriglobales bacterium]
MPVKSPVKKDSAKNAPLAILHADLFSNIPWLLHGFSTRTGGFSRVYGGNALNLGFTKEDSRNLVEKNRAAFLQKLGAANKEQNWPLVTLRQIHSDLIHCVTTPPMEQLAGDGLITCDPEIVLGIQTADCLPIILVDTKKRAVGVFHAGWRGTMKRIVEKGVGEMRRCFGSMPRDIKAAIGPGIRGCCYEVGEEVRRAFEAQFEYASALFREAKDSDHIRERYPMLFLTSRAPGHSDLPKRIYLDLAEANRRQLLAAGVFARNIESSPLCTACRTDLLFSCRKEKGGTGRMLAAVGIKASK